jgi:hypothetical protein
MATTNSSVFGAYGHTGNGFNRVTGALMRLGVTGALNMRSAISSGCEAIDAWLNDSETVIRPRQQKIYICLRLNECEGVKILKHQIYENMNSDLITTIANLALTLSFIVAVIFGIAQVKVAARDRRERLTLGTLSAFQTRDFAELIYAIEQLKPMSGWKDMKALPAEEQIKFIQFSQEMEALGILVAEKLINMDLVDKTLGAFVVTSWDKFKLMFYDARTNIPDPFLAEYFQWLAERIEERMQKTSREPYFVSGKINHER